VSFLNEEYKKTTQKFWDSLEKITNAERAILKRNLGFNLKNARGEAIGVFYKIYPFYDSYSDQHEEIFFLVSTLYAFHRNHSKSEESFGKVLMRLRSSDSFDKKVLALLDSELSPNDSELLHRLSQLIRMADAKGIGVNFDKLLQDLLSWNHEDRYVQRKWAKDYHN
jgi:CRISPR type I-E-associated protein CasB/Cse2